MSGRQVRNWRWNYIYYRNMAGHVYGRFFAMATQGLMICDSAATEWLRKELREALASNLLREDNFDKFRWYSLIRFMDSAEKLSLYLNNLFHPLVELLDKVSHMEVVIFGCKSQGRYLSDIFCISGMKVRVYCDNDQNMHHVFLGGKEVLYPSEAVALYPKAAYILTSKRHAETMRKQLMGLGIDGSSIINEWKVCISPKHTLWTMINYMDKKTEG